MVGQLVKPAHNFRERRVPLRVASDRDKTLAKVASGGKGRRGGKAVLRLGAFAGVVPDWF